MLKVDGVFAGGGIKAFAFVGALRALKKHNIQFERIAGTSAGAITASLIKAGFTADEIGELFDEVNLEDFLTKQKKPVIFRFYRWIRMYHRMGLYSGDTLEEWLYKTLKKKGITTFYDLPPDSLKIVASDLSNGKILVLPDDLPNYGIIPENFSVAKAVRMSCSLPFFFQPVKLKDRTGKYSIIVDGGISSNFPIWLFANQGIEKKPGKRPVIGFRLTPSTSELEPREVKNALSMLFSMVDTMRSAHDQRYISKNDAKNIVFIPVDHVSPTNFSVSDEERKQLTQLGETSTLDFLKKWTY